MTYDLRKPEVIKLECPFCGKQTVKAIHYPSMLQASSSRSAAAGRKIKYYRTKEKYEIASGCSACGKSEKEIQKALKKRSVKDYTKRIEELRKAGLPTEITHKVRSKGFVQE